MSDACIEGHNLAEERLKAEAEAKEAEEAEEQQAESVVPTGEGEEGPEVIVVGKKQAEEEEKTEEAGGEE
jgi:small subunit ribosomal protein S2